MEQRLDLKTSDGHAYPVYFGIALADFFAAVWQPRWQAVALVGDDTTRQRFFPAVEEALAPHARRVLPLSFPPGEAHKTRHTKATLEDAMLGAELDRDAVVVAVGGGIPLDIAGFVAATYLRGIPYLAVATTLLAQVDAAVGGKTGVNTPFGKNLVGAFHQPAAVLCATPWLKSLPDREMRNGLAEAVKHGVVADACLFADLEVQAASGRLQPQDEILRRCVAAKAAVVSRDTHELGFRRILNFGHTVGHALESASAHRLSHGEAVALGMVVESFLARQHCGFPAADQGRLRRLLARFGLPVRPAENFDQLGPFLARDKKNRAGAIHCALPTGLGQMAGAGEGWSTPVAAPDLAAAYSAAQAEEEA